MTPAKILIVEDDRVVARDIRHQLTRIGHTVVGSTTFGEEAVPQALGLHPDLVLMDIRLEGALDGIDAAQQIRDRCQIPVVFLTAYADDETLQRARVTEPFGYLLKPFEDSELRTVIEMALYKHAAERRLRDSERRYAVTLSSIGDAVIATDSQARVTFLNPVAEALTGWPPREATGRPLGEVFHIVSERTRHPVEDPVAKVLSLGTVVGLANRTLLLARDGGEVPIDDCGAPIIDDRGGITGVVLVFHDVTQRRRAEAALQESEERFRSMFETASIGMAITDFEGHLLQVNRSYEQMAGYTAEELRTLTFLDLTHPDDRPYSRQVMEDLLTGRRESHHFEKRCLRKDGTLLWLHVTDSIIKDQSGKPRYLVGMAVDITERKLVEEVLRKSHQDYATLVASIDGIVWEVDVQTFMFTFVSNKAERLLGYPIEQWLTEPTFWMDHIDPEDRELAVNLCVTATKEKRDHDFEYRMIAADGRTVWLRDIVNVVAEKGECVKLRGVMVDITERKQAEAKLKETLEEIRRLKAQLELENAYLLEEVVEAKAFGELVGQSAALKRIVSQIDIVAPTDATVMILGETGTGKELVAREIHNRSRRKDQAMIRVNCASVPKELYESEFFGHVKGAFTGAIKDRAGRFEAADGGTLFLDEIAEIPLELQSKLLRALQEKQYERVGDDTTKRVDVRIIAATNRDLKQEVDAGRFRRDLYYRLNVFPIQVASLRDRREDIPLLAAHFVDVSVRELGCACPRLTQAGIARLQGYDWPGNIRELRNVIERAVILARGGALDFDLPITASAAVQSLSSSQEGEKAAPEILSEPELRRRDRENLLAALNRTDWKIYGPSGAAELLGMKPTTLLSRMKLMGLKRPLAGRAVRLR